MRKTGHSALTHLRDASEGVDLRDEPSISPSDVKAAVRDVLRAAEKGRTPPPAFVLEPTSADFSVFYVDPLDEVMGEILSLRGATPSPTEPLPAILSHGSLPLLSGLYEKFVGKVPQPKIVRADTEADYREFRNARREPYLAALEERIERLEDAVGRHLADHHGGGRVERLERAFLSHVSDLHGGGIPEDELAALHADVDAHLEAALAGGHRVPVPLPAWDRSTECWRDGDEILCSMRVLAPDRKVRVLTTAAPAEGRLDEVVGHVIGAGVDPFAIVGALPMLSCILGGRTLVGELASVARPLAARAAKEGRSLVMKARPMVNPPGIAAVMSLLQKCQAGNRRACMEAGRLTATAAGKEIYDEAAEHLLHAQASEALRRVAP